jgi:hypothetical protein
MAIIAKGGGDFTPCPEGLHLGCCVDVIDKGDVEGRWGTRHKVVLVWETSQKMEDGRPFQVRKMYTLSLSSMATLYKDLVAWRGQPFTAAELKGFDVEKVIGTSCQLFVQHRDREGSTWSDVSAITKAPNGQRLKPSGNYVRVKDREPANDDGDAFGRQAGDDGFEGYDDLPEEPLRLPERQADDAIPF